MIDKFQVKQIINKNNKMLCQPECNQQIQIDNNNLFKHRIFNNLKKQVNMLAINQMIFLKDKQHL